ncbi:hypothetical protein PI124_g21397 [Phytophthora idaei]|nr:hypothetical protein PI125_g24000 [Phytophthora idaei]KAG3233530.1 hypothetical protein PI124_g21397 [Phytophthora idaei]
MTKDKMGKAKTCFETTLAATHLSRADYRFLLGRIRHVATCALLDLFSNVCASRNAISVAGNVYPCL